MKIGSAITKIECTEKQFWTLGPGPWTMGEVYSIDMKIKKGALEALVT